MYYANKKKEILVGVTQLKIECKKLLLFKDHKSPQIGEQISGPQITRLLRHFILARRPLNLGQRYEARYGSQYVRTIRK